jgi:hypothetical protein
MNPLRVAWLVVPPHRTFVKLAHKWFFVVKFLASQQKNNTRNAPAVCDDTKQEDNARTETTTNILSSSHAALTDLDS